MNTTYPRLQRPPTDRYTGSDHFRCCRNQRHFAAFLVCLLTLSWADLIDGAESIESERLAITVDVEHQQFRILDKTVGSTFVPRGKFVRPIASVKASSVQDQVWGPGRQLTVKHNNGWSTLIRLFSDQPFAHFHTIAANPTDKPLSLKRANLLEFDYDLGIPVDRVRTLGTSGLHTPAAPGSYTFAAAADPESRRGVVCGWLTHERGVGVFFPRSADGRNSMATRIEFGQFRVEPRAQRPLDILLIGRFDDARLGLEAYANAVARQYDIHLKPQPAVYCTWYHAGASNEENLAENTRFAAKHLKPFGLDVMQIDDKWQSILPKGFDHQGKIQTTGPIKVFVDANANYPGGMALTAKLIGSKGMTPGIWFMPFAGNFRNPYFDEDLFAKKADGTPFHDGLWSGTCLDLTQAKAQAFVAQRVKRIHGWGYRYFKLDGMHTGAPSHNLYVHKKYRDDTFPDSRLHDLDMTHIQAYRKGLQIVRDNAPDTFILGCNVSQNMISMGPAFGLIDAMRIGPDNGGAARGKWNQVKLGAWHGSTLYFLNGRIWHNDPDPVYVRPSNPLDKARLMCSWVAVSGSMLTTSYQFSRLPEERLDLLKRTMPGTGLCGRPADLFETDQPRIWLLTDKRRRVRRDVIGLFNWDEEQPAEMNYEMGKLGLDPNIRYVAYDFWKKTFIEPIRGTLKQTLPGGTCCILAVRPEANHPQLLSTSRHIAQCIVDVLQESWDPVSRTLRGKSRVVAGDPYEFRIALPKGSKWEVESATAGADQLTQIKTNKLGVCLVFTPERSGEVDWQIQFRE